MALQNLLRGMLLAAVRMAVFALVLIAVWLLLVACVRTRIQVWDG